jgi:EAL domain-containing protein (putative c-di-GMP-specific phosphodiesterase class I)/CheY-like chemotaxis protein
MAPTSDRTLVHPGDKHGVERELREAVRPSPASETEQSTRIGVVIADDDQSLRFALSALLSDDASLELLAAAADAEQAIELAERHQPHVCVIDVTMPRGGGAHATRTIRERCPNTEVLALSGRQDRESVVDMLRAGACGYVVKGSKPDEFVRAVRDAARGQRTLSPELTAGVVEELSDHLAREDAHHGDRRVQKARIDHVLARGLLDVAVQPIVDLRTRDVLAFEALARIRSEPVRSPAVWFAEAADHGRLLELELAAIDAALAVLPLLPDAAQLTVNVSPATAASERFYEAMPSDGASGRIVVEITEHAPIDDYDALAPQIERLRRRGIRLAIDDAGAGFASLRHILRFNPDIIKTDMTLTRGIETDRAERALMRALISFAAEIDATLVAEGIESDAEIKALRELGVIYGQGFHLGRPVPWTRRRNAPTAQARRTRLG